MVWTILPRLSIGTLEGCLEDCNGTSGFTRCSEIVEELQNRRLLKKAPPHGVTYLLL
jgi:hypothetical protein